MGLVMNFLVDVDVENLMNVVNAVSYGGFVSIEEKCLYFPLRIVRNLHNFQ